MATEAKNEDAQSWAGQKVTGRDGSKLGKLEHVYLDNEGGRPTWGVVKGGPLGRKRHFVPLGEASAEGGGVTVPVDGEHVKRAPAVPSDRELRPETESQLRRHYESSDAMSAAQERQREEYGGFNIGAAFFGWLVAVALTTLIAALLGAIAAAIGSASNLGGAQLTSGAGIAGIVGAALLAVVLFLAYLGGGYVAGRMSRFDGALQGAGVWLFGLAVTLLLTVLGLVFGSQFNLLQQISVPTVPIPAGSLTVGGVIAVVAIVVASIAGAVVGGKLGERYHGKVDRTGYR